MSEKNTVIVVAYPDRGEGNDPEPFFFLRGVGSLSQPRLNIFTVDNMGVMICLGQRGLRSLSASSFAYKIELFFRTSPNQHPIYNHNAKIVCLIPGDFAFVVVF